MTDRDEALGDEDRLSTAEVQAAAEAARQLGGELGGSPAGVTGTPTDGGGEAGTLSASGDQGTGGTSPIGSDGEDDDETGDEGGTRPEHVEIRQGGASQVDADHVTIYQGGAARVRAETVEVHQGGIAFAQAGEVELEDQSGAFAVVAGEAEIEDSRVFLLIARRVSGDVRPVLDWRSALALGVGVVVARSLATRVLGGRQRSSGVPSGRLPG